GAGSTPSTGTRRSTSGRSSTRRCSGGFRPMASGTWSSSTSRSACAARRPHSAVMCGIAGIVKLDPAETVDEARLKRMRDVLRHRGPDGEGLWIDGPVGLGHRRLSIVDVAAGHQPMPSEDERAWIVYNGEVYNHAELAADLRARGHRYRTRSDTETVLHLYEEEGIGCVERLRGM